MEDFDKYLDQLVENFFDTGKLVLNETIDTINWDKIGKVIRDPNKSEQIYELLIDMFPNAKEVIDYNYYGDNEEPSPNDTFAEMKSFLWNIDKNTIKGPDLQTILFNILHIHSYYAGFIFSGLNTTYCFE